MGEHLSIIEKIENFGKVYDFFSYTICKKYEITQIAFEILGFLSAFPDRNTAKEICSIRCIKSSNASITIEKMVKNGYIRRESDTKDRRIQRLELTEKAQPVVEDAKRLHDSFERAVFSDLTEEEKAQFFLLIDKMHLSITNTLKEYQEKYHSDDK